MNVIDIVAAVKMLTHSLLGDAGRQINNLSQSNSRAVMQACAEHWRNRAEKVMGFAWRGMMKGFIKKVMVELCLRDEQNFQDWGTGDRPSRKREQCEKKPRSPEVASVGMGVMHG